METEATETSELVPKPKERSKNFFVALYCAGLLISAVGNSIFFKKMTNHMPNYVYFLSQVTTVVYVPIFTSLVIYERIYTNYITKEMLEIPKSKFCLLGVFDSLAGICMLFGGVHTSGSRQALLVNGVIPVTMILAYFVLKTRFSLSQYIGAATILSGVIVVILPQFLGSAPTNNFDQPLFNIIFIFSTLPNALSSIYKEYLFNSTDIDVNYLQAWVAIWQVAFGLLMIPLNTLSILGPNALTWSKLPESLINGARCLAGYNTITLPNCYLEGAEKTAGLRPCDDCSGAWIPVVIYLFFNCNYNIFITLVIKYGSASLLYIIMTLRLPLVQLAFAIRFINDPPDPIPLASVLGLLMILLGLVAYRWPTPQQKLEEGEEEVAVPFFGTQTFPATIRRKVMAHMRRSAGQIRSSLYSRLGVIPSPVTPRSRPPSRSVSRGSNRKNQTRQQERNPRTSYGATLQVEQGDGRITASSDGLGSAGERPRSH